jgi:hypothetical protein
MTTSKDNVRKDCNRDWHSIATVASAERAKIGATSAFFGIVKGRYQLDVAMSAFNKTRRRKSSVIRGATKPA